MDDIAMRSIDLHPVESNQAMMTWIHPGRGGFSIDPRSARCQAEPLISQGCRYGPGSFFSVKKS